MGTKNKKHFYLYTSLLCAIAALSIACSEESIKAWDTSKKSTENPIILRASIGATIEELDLFTIPEETSFNEISTFQTNYKTITDKITDKLKQDYNKEQLQQSYDTAKETLKGKELLLVSELEQELDLFLETNTITTFDEDRYKTLKENHSKLSTFVFLDSETKERLDTLINNSTMLQLSWASSVKTNLLKQIDLETVTKENKNDTLKEYKTLPTFDSIVNDSQPYKETTGFFNTYMRQLNSELAKLERISNKIKVVSVKYDREDAIDNTIKLLNEFIVSSQTKREAPPLQEAPSQNVERIPSAPESSDDVVPTPSIGLTADSIPEETVPAPQVSELEKQQSRYKDITEKIQNKLRYKYRRKELDTSYKKATKVLRAAELQDIQNLHKTITVYLSELNLDKVEPEDYTVISDHYQKLSQYPTLTENDLKKLNVHYRNATILDLAWQTHEKLVLYTTLQKLDTSTLTPKLLTQAINSEPSLEHLENMLKTYALVSSGNKYKQLLERYNAKLKVADIKIQKLKQNIQVKDEKDS